TVVRKYTTAVGYVPDLMVSAQTGAVRNHRCDAWVYPSVIHAPAHLRGLRSRCSDLQSPGLRVYTEQLPG
ncbi:MAG: hypothetical protein WAV79_19460, partial [Anaerolineae bacterium]